MSQPTDLAVKRELILFVIYWMENFVLVLISAEKDGESGLKVFVVANRAGGGGIFRDLCTFSWLPDWTTQPTRW